MNKTVIHPPFLSGSCCAGEATLAESSGGSRSSSQAAARVVRISLLERASPSGSAPLDPKPASSSVPAAAAAATYLPLSLLAEVCAPATGCTRSEASSSVASLSFPSLRHCPSSALHSARRLGRGCFCLICIDVDDSLPFTSLTIPLTPILRWWAV